MSSFFAQFTSKQSIKFIDQVQEPFKNLPHLPDSVIEFVAKIAPVLAIIGGFLWIVVVGLQTLVASLSLLSLNPAGSMFMIVSAVISLLMGALFLMAYKPLQARKMEGWVYLFWTEVLYTVTVLLDLVEGRVFSFVPSLIGVLIGFYFVFEIRKQYK